MITAKISQKDLRRIHKMLTKLSPRERGNAIYSGMAKGGNIVEKQIKRNLSGPILKTRTGRFKQSIQTYIVNKTNQIKVWIGSGVRTGGRMPQANIHEVGGVIKPKKGKFLRFVIGNAVIFAKRVVIPKRLYLSKSLKQVQGKMVQGLINTINEQLKKLGAR